MTIDYVGIAYAATVAAGGIMGYVKAGSIPSLGAGVLFGSALGYGAYQISRDSSNVMFSLGTSAILGGLMGLRYYNSHKFMPSGLIAVMSVAMILKLGYQIITSNGSGSDAHKT